MELIAEVAGQVNIAEESFFVNAALNFGLLSFLLARWTEHQLVKYAFQVWLQLLFNELIVKSRVKVLK